MRKLTKHDLIKICNVTAVLRSKTSDIAVLICSFAFMLWARPQGSPQGSSTLTALETIDLVDENRFMLSELEVAFSPFVCARTKLTLPIDEKFAEVAC